MEGNDKITHFTEGYTKKSYHENTHKTVVNNLLFDVTVWNLLY